MSGLTSTHLQPNANHVWRFCKRKVLSEIGQAVENNHETWVDCEDPDDVCLLLKQFMSSAEQSQPPLLVMPVAVASKIDNVFPAHRVPINDIKELKKTAEAVAQGPWNLFKAQAFLLDMCEKNEAGHLVSLSSFFIHCLIELSFQIILTLQGLKVVPSLFDVRLLLILGLGHIPIPRPLRFFFEYKLEKLIMDDQVAPQADGPGPPRQVNIFKPSAAELRKRENKASQKRQASQLPMKRPSAKFKRPANLKCSTHQMLQCLPVSLWLHWLMSLQLSLALQLIVKSQSLQNLVVPNASGARKVVVSAESRRTKANTTGRW